MISVVLSFRNEEEVIPELIRRLHEAFTSIHVDYELVFVNDDSTDDSLPVLVQQARENHRVKIVNMSRRFGVYECVLAGMKYSRGDAVVYMDADLQDPPEVIPELVEIWEEGADVVYTVRASREGEPFFKMLATKAAYRLIRSLSNVDLLVEAGDFKLLSRRVVDELLKLEEQDPYLRGLITWIGFNQVPVYYERQRRAAGETHFSLLRNFMTDLTTFQGPAGALVRGITSFSITPLIFFLLIGMFMVFAFSAVAVAVIVLKVLEVPLPQSSVVLVAVFWLSGVQLVGIGVLGLYLARVYREVSSRPRYIVDNTVGFENDAE